MPFRNVAGNILKHLFFYFSEKIRLDITCKSHEISLIPTEKNIKNNFEMLFSVVVIGPLMVNTNQFVG